MSNGHCRQTSIQNQKHRRLLPFLSFPAMLHLLLSSFFCLSCTLRIPSKLGTPYPDCIQTEWNFTPFPPLSALAEAKIVRNQFKLYCILVILECQSDSFQIINYKISNKSKDVYVVPRFTIYIYIYIMDKTSGEKNICCGKMKLSHFSYPAPYLILETSSDSSSIVHSCFLGCRFSL